MPQLLVAKKLNKRSRIPGSLPDAAGIVDVVQKGYVFYGTLAGGQTLPPAPLDKWYIDESGYYYWGGAIVEIQRNDNPVPVINPPGQLSLLQIKYATGATPKNAEKFMQHIIAACTRYSINTPVRQLCFLAQVGHESMGLYYTEEIASGAAYENRADLGNIQPGDGVRFKGRGLIQITGRSNYKTLSAAFGQDFITDPSLLGAKNADKCSDQQLQYAALSAGWFWNSRSLNNLADQIDLNSSIDAAGNQDVFKKITKKINGGLNGFSDRVTRYRGGVGFLK